MATFNVVERGSLFDFEKKLQELTSINSTQSDDNQEKNEQFYKFNLNLSLDNCFKSKKFFMFLELKMYYYRYILLFYSKA